MNDTPRLFGTDGIRGTFGAFPLDEATVRRLGLALARRLSDAEPDPLLVLGGDTRDSTPILSRWMASGLHAGGARTRFVGTVPTPAVARLTRDLGAASGVVISASHNPHPDNGIKLIDGDGFKWPPAREAELEEELEDTSVPDSPIGELEVDRGLVREYLDALAATVSASSGGTPLAGLAVALDTGHGAASAYAEELFTRLGARVTLVNAAPDGRNINAGCGSTHPEILAELVRASSSDIGFSFDGDADRVILADETGEIRDGDAVLYLWARDLAAHGRLPGNRIVATSMSNLGLEVALRRSGIELVRCGVGDRTVVTAMRDAGIALGGEQSGHVVHLELSTTGDGLLTALRMADLRARDGRPLSEMLAGFERFPQLLENVRVRDKVPFEEMASVMAAKERVEAALGTDGRLVLRYSGTEPLARVMIEGPDRDQVEALAAELAGAIAREIGA